MPFGPQGCALFPREIYSQGTIVKAPWKSTQLFPSPYPFLLAHRVVLIFCNAKHNREGTQHKSQGKIMQSPPPQEQSNSEPSLPSWQGFSKCPIMSLCFPDPENPQSSYFGIFQLGNVDPTPRGFVPASPGESVSKRYSSSKALSMPGGSVGVG